MRRTRYLFLHAFLLVIVTLLALPAAPLSAQSDGGVHMEVTPAYDGYFKYGEWLQFGSCSKTRAATWMEKFVSR
jgi:hypothetical protein